MDTDENKDLTLIMKHVSRNAQIVSSWITKSTERKSSQEKKTEKSQTLTEMGPSFFTNRR